MKLQSPSNCKKQVTRACRPLLILKDQKYTWSSFVPKKTYLPSDYVWIRVQYIKAEIYSLMNTTICITMTTTIATSERKQFILWSFFTSMKRIKTAIVWIWICSWYKCEPPSLPLRSFHWLQPDVSSLLGYAKPWMLPHVLLHTHGYLIWFCLETRLLRISGKMHKDLPSGGFSVPRPVIIICILKQRLCNLRATDKIWNPCFSILKTRKEADWQFNPCPGH
jgi:hypothetical protein